MLMCMQIDITLLTAHLHDALLVQEKSMLVRMRTDIEKAANRLETERQATERKQV